MKRVLILLLLACFAFDSSRAASSASASITQQGTTPIRSGNNNTNTDSRPRMQRSSSSFLVSYDSVGRAILVNSSVDEGLVIAIIENLSTGAYYFYSFDSSKPAILPISGDAGDWRVTFFLSSRSAIGIEFLID